MALVGGKIQIRTIYHLRLVYDFFMFSCKMQGLHIK